jgi:hypothetical protein
VRRLDARQVGKIANVRITAIRIPPLVHRQVAAPTGFRASRIAPLDRRQVGTVARIGTRVVPVAPPAAVTQFLPATIRTNDEPVARPDLLAFPRPVVTID